MVYDVVVIGAGPAGISASIQLKRAGFSSLLIEKDKLGGLCNQASLIENYPGFPKGIEAKKLIFLFKKQLKENQIEIRKDQVTNISKKEGFFAIKTNLVTIKSHSVIVATGTESVRPTFKFENDVTQNKIFYDINRLPSTNIQKHVTIIGGGDIAFDYALSLIRKGYYIDILFRSHEPRALQLLVKRAMLLKKITLRNNTKALSANYFNKKLNIVASTGKDRFKILSDYILIACGRKSNIEFIDPALKKRLKIYADGSSNISGLFFAGDVFRKNMRQIGIAIGDGLYSAMEISTTQ